LSSKRAGFFGSFVFSSALQYLTAARKQADFTAEITMHTATETISETMISVN
jgi:hypothetical protein